MRLRYGSDGDENRGGAGVVCSVRLRWRRRAAHAGGTRRWRAAAAGAAARDAAAPQQ